MRKITTLSMLCLGTTCLINQSTAAGPVSFQQAVADYTAGKYSQADSELEGYKRAYPTNAMVHYYLALCKQALGHLESAKAEYLWVTQYGDARLKGMAQAGFDQLSKARTSTSSSVAAAPTTAPAAAPSAAPQIASAKVKKIIEFYADW